MKAEKESADVNDYDNETNNSELPPIAEILKNMQNDNKKAYKYYNSVMGKVNDRNRTMHYLAVHHNLEAAFHHPFHLDAPLESYQTFDYNCTLPKPITPSQHTSSNIDIVADVLIAKRDWSQKLHLQLSKNTKRQQFRDITEINSKLIETPPVFIDVAKHFEQDPDPYLDFPSNWHFYGNGNIHTVSFLEKSYILHSSISVLKLTPLQIYEDETVLDLDKTLTFDCGDNKHILEIIYKCREHLSIAVRTRTTLYLLSIEVIDGCPENIKLVHAFESDVPITSADFDLIDDILYISYLDIKVDIINMTCKNRIRMFLEKRKSTKNAFSCVKSFDKRCFLYADKCSVSLFNKRDKTKKLTITFKDLCRNSCTIILLIYKSPTIKKCFYTVTSHEMFLVSINYDMTKNKYKHEVIQRWTHGMQSEPSYIHCIIFEENKELICLCSQYAGDVCLVVNTYSLWHIKNKKQASANFIPYRPSNLFDTLKKAQLNGMCLDPHLTITERVSNCVTGVFLLEKDDTFKLLMINSSGDITEQIFYPKHLTMKIDNNNVIQKMSEWSAGIAQEKQLGNIKVTSICDIRKYFQYLKKNDANTLDETMKNPLNFSESTYSIAELRNHLVTNDFDVDLFSVWDVDELKVE